MLHTTLSDPDPLPLGGDDIPSPRCCGEEMICYPGVAHECAVAYFDLLDDGVLDSISCSPPQLDDEIATDEHRRRLAHLRETRIPLAG